MKSAIEELIFLNSSFMERIPYNETYLELTDFSNKIYKKLKKTLNQDQIELLDKLMDNHTDLSTELSACNLLYGFKTGLKLIIECL